MLRSRRVSLILLLVLVLTTGDAATAQERAHAAKAEQPGALHFPDATTTGPPDGLALKRSASLVITVAGTVVDAVDIQGPVVIAAPNVTLKNCKVSAGTDAVILVRPGVTGTVVQHCDIDNRGAGGQGIAGQGTFAYNNIHDCADGIDVRGDNTTIQDNFIHSMRGRPTSHFDGIQADGGWRNLIISHNTVINEQDQTSAIMLSNYWGAVDNVKIDNNYLAGGGYTVYINEGNRSNSSGKPMTHVSFTNNLLRPGTYGALTILAQLGHRPVLSKNKVLSRGTSR